MRRIGTFVIALLALIALPHMAQAKSLSVVKPTADCGALARPTYNADGNPVRVTSAKIVEGAAPYCQVIGYVAPAVHFELRLPTTNWQQRLLFTGCGGFCGAVSIRAPVAEGCVPLTNGEFAMVSSDLGHSAPGNDGVWASGNPQGIKDYGNRAVHVTTAAAKTILVAYYGQKQAYAYFDGCSDGGREGMMEVQRYPDDFDGVVAGAPVINDTANNSIYHAWNVQHLTTRDGKPLISDALMGVVYAEVVKQCDKLDGVADGMVAAPDKCKFNSRVLLCKPGKTDNCLSPEQLAAVDAVHQGPVNAAGQPLYVGAPLGSEKTWNMWAGLAGALGSSFVTYMTDQPFTGPKDIYAVGYEANDLAIYNRAAPEINALDPDLSRFASHAKLLMWHGWSDAGVPAGHSLLYYGQVRAKMGAAATDAFMRLYMLPGVNHCGGGDGPDKLDLLTPLMTWVEDGTAPGNVAAAHVDKDKRVDWTIVPFDTGQSKPVLAAKK